ncbi:MAG: ABC transporter ATP-binding protein/permease [Firmicutes bacterium]|nr:ABC transporter ATP-binding protein/permease [Bacillota bacterium]
MDESEKREQTLSKIIKTCRLMLEFAWRERNGHLFIFIKALTAIMSAGFSVVYALIPGFIINELTESARTEYLVAYVALLAGSSIAGFYINKYCNLKMKTLRDETELKYRVDFFSDTLDMDYEKLETPDVQYLKERADYALDNVFGFVEIVMALFSAILSIAAMSSVISTLNPFMILLAAASVYINFATAKRSNYIRYMLEKETDKYEELKSMFGYMMNSYGSSYFYTREIKMFGAKDFLLHKYAESSRQLNKIKERSQRKTSVSDTVCTITNAVQQAILYAYLIYCVIAAGLSVGGLSIYMSAVDSLSSALGAVFEQYLELSTQSLNIQDYIEFVNIPSKQKNCGHKIPEFRQGSVIEFHDVSFKYPGSDRYAVKDLNLKIRCGERLSVVGENGSGKSTFIKLLTRLYFPQDGEITLDGVNINEFEGEEYQKIFSAVFQDFNLYPFSMGENVTLSNESDTERLDTVYVRCGLDELEEELSYGSDTEVGKNIDPEGFEPSGGEGQKIAIARAIYHDAPVYLLDEPTAALDPLSEYKIYKQFNEMVGDRCAVLITHRLSAVALADKVAVFDDGHVAEYGTHSELYEMGGIYRDMFDKQAEFYREV